MTRLISPTYQKIWDACRGIPDGKVAPYSYLAERIGKPKGARLVARAMAANPYAPQVPCHRVVRKDGTLAGYSAVGGVQKKKQLLLKEGVRFDRAGKVLKEFILLGALIMPLTLAQSITQPVKNPQDFALRETMESMGEIEHYFLGIRRKFVGSPSLEEVRRYKKEMTDNLNEWGRLAKELSNNPYAKEKTKLWNEYVNSITKELNFMKSVLSQENWENLWLHFDRLLDIERKSHKEFRPGLLKSLKRLFGITKN